MVAQCAGGNRRMNRLILIRHGETEGNVAKRLDTALPGAPLTERGVAQAQDLGRRLRGRKVAELVSSQALRAKQTGEIIATEAGFTVDAVDGIHEVQAGDLEDRTDEAAHKTFREVFHAWHLGDLSARPPGGESGADVLDRYLPVVEQLRPRLDDGDVLIVSHGAAIRLVGRHLGGVPGEFASRNHLDNTDTVELVPDGDGWACVRWGRREPPFVDAESAGVDDPMG